jgi:hypothetical protein
MTFFYDLNKRLADLAKKQDAAQLTESAVVAEKADYSAKKAAAGKDIGKPGKMFSKIAKSAGKEYGSKAAGERVAGAVLNKLRAKESVDEGVPNLKGHDTKYGVVVVGHNDGKPVKTFDNEADAKAFADKGIRVGGGLKQGSVRTMVAAKKKTNEANMDESALQAYIGDKKYGKAGMDALRKAGREGASKDKMSQIRNRYNKMDEADMEEGNEFSGELAQARAAGAKQFKVDGKSYPVKEEGGMPMTPKQKSFAKLAPPVDKITFADKIAGAKKEVDEMLGDVAAEAIKKAVKKSEPRSKGTAFDPEVARTMITKDPHPRHDVKDTGYSKRYTRKEEPEAEKDDEVSDQPKKKGRPKGPAKGPERVTAKSYKYKSGRPAKVAENDVDTVDRGEYDREGDMAKEQMHTIMSAAKELHGMLRDEENLPEWVQKKITLAKEYIDTARDYMATQHAERAEEEPIAEKAVSKKQQRFMGMVHAAQKGEKPASGAVAKVAKGMGKKDAKDFAATKHKGLPEKVKEEGTDKEDQHAERAGKKVTKDLEYDMKHKGKDDSKAERAGKKVTKDIEYDDKKDKVKESNKGGYNFGGGVYESLDRQFKQALTEGMNVSVNMSTGQDGQPTKNITISADGEDADRLAELLKMAGLDSQDSGCKTCGASPCGCESLDENSPDWPTNTETSDNALQYSGGLNGPKSTGQTTVPVVASQLRRQVSMEESVKFENDLFRLYQNYKAQ